MQHSQIFVHPEARKTVLPHLLSYLPSPVNQEYLIIHPISSSSLVLVSFPPGSVPTTTDPWSVAVLDITRPGETELWFWSSIEHDPEHEDVDPAMQHTLFAQGYQLLQSTIAFVARLHPTKEILAIGSLNELYVPHIPTNIIQRLPEPYTKLVFTPENVPAAAPDLDEKYLWKPLRVEDLDQVVATSAVKRFAATLAKLPCTGAYPRDGDQTPHAWCFTSVEGTMGSLYVRPDARRAGLGKAVMRVELMKNFEGEESSAEDEAKQEGEEKWKRRFVVADVHEGNVASTRVCDGLGGRRWRGWKCVWMGVYLESFIAFGMQVV